MENSDKNIREKKIKLNAKETKNRNSEGIEMEMERLHNDVAAGSNEQKSCELQQEIETDSHKRKSQRNQQRGKKVLKNKTNEEELLIPIITRDNDNIYTCLACETEEKFSGESKAIISHVKNKHDARVYICDVCGEHFRKRAKFRNHLDEHIATEEGDFQCELCNRIFSNLRLFRIHKRMHNPQAKIWSCEMCNKRYSSQNLLDEHINTHIGVRPYVCKLCGKDFTSKYTFQGHERTHEMRERTFRCSYCPKAFFNKHNLNQHERTHFKVKKRVKIS